MSTLMTSATSKANHPYQSIQLKGGAKAPPSTGSLFQANQNFNSLNAPTHNTSIDQLSSA